MFLEIWTLRSIFFLECVVMASEEKAMSEEPAVVESSSVDSDDKTVETNTVETPTVETSTEKPVESTPVDAVPGTSKEGEGGGDVPKEMVTFKVVYNKQKQDVTYNLDSTILDLKKSIETKIGVPAAMQKVMYKGLAKDHLTLRELKVTKGAKFMVVGSTVNDLLSVTPPDPKTLKAEEKAEAAASKEPLSSQKQHKKVLEKYEKPDDCIPGIKGKKESLPHVPLSGMINKSGGKVRLTFKLENDQLWIGTKERTDKIPMGSIKAVVSEPILDKEEYHIMGIQLGPTEASRYWIYYVPAQYVDAIKDAILGKWQFF